MRYSTTQRCPKQETKKMKTPPKTPKHQWWRSNTCLMIWWTASEYCGKQPLWQGGTAEKTTTNGPTAPCAPWCLAGSVILTSCRFMTSLSRILNHSDIELLEPNCHCNVRISANAMQMCMSLRFVCVYIYVYYIIYMNMLHEHVLIIQWNNQAHVISLIVWFTYVLDG